MKFTHLSAILTFALAGIITSARADGLVEDWWSFPASPSLVGDSLIFGFSASLSGNQEFSYFDEELQEWVTGGIGFSQDFATFGIDFGDGSSVIGGSGTHTYLTAGLYTVTAHYGTGDGPFVVPYEGWASRSVQILSVPDTGSTMPLLGLVLTSCVILDRKRRARNSRAQGVTC